MKYLSGLIVAAGIALGGTSASAQANFDLAAIPASEQFVINVAGTQYTIGFYTPGDVSSGLPPGASWNNYKADNDVVGTGEGPGVTDPAGTGAPQDGSVSSTPWWGSSDIAKQFADAFVAQVTFPALGSIPADLNAYAFGFGEAVSLGQELVGSWAAVYDSRFTPPKGFATEVGIRSDSVESFAFGSPVDPSAPQASQTLNWAVVLSDNFNQRPVPEIDGPVMVQVGFALMGLYVLMLGRRRREDELDMSQSA